jgi:hypothetical protein
MKPYGQNGGKAIFNEGISPIATIVHLYHDRPQLKTSDQYGKVPDIDPDTGVQRAEFKATLAWPHARAAELGEMVNMAQQTQEQGWPGSTAPGAHFFLQPFFRDGNNPEHNTENKDYLRDRYYLNFKKKAKIEAMRPNEPIGPNNYKYTGAPGLLGPFGPEDIIMPGDLWAGCQGRVSFIMFATEYMGKHFISVRMQNVQKYDEGDGTRIGGGGTPAASSQFGALKEGGPPAQMGGMGAFGGAGAQPNPFGIGTASPQGGGAFAPAPNPFGAPPSSPTNPFGAAPAGGGFKIL